jgi:hypothetical protein
VFALILAILAGASLVLAPYFAWQMWNVDHRLGILVGALALPGLALALFIASELLVISVIVAMLTVTIVLYRYRPPSHADLIVSEPLLADAISPEVAVELAKLEEQALHGDLDADPEGEVEASL